MPVSLFGAIHRANVREVRAILEGGEAYLKERDLEGYYPLLRVLSHMQTSRYIIEENYSARTNETYKQQLSDYLEIVDLLIAHDVDLNQTSIIENYQVVTPLLFVARSYVQRVGLNADSTIERTLLEKLTRAGAQAITIDRSKDSMPYYFIKNLMALNGATKSEILRVLRDNQLLACCEKRIDTQIIPPLVAEWGEDYVYTKLSMNLRGSNKITSVDFVIPYQRAVWSDEEWNDILSLMIVKPDIKEINVEVYRVDSKRLAQGLNQHALMKSSAFEKLSLSAMLYSPEFFELFSKELKENKTVKTLSMPGCLHSSDDVMKTLLGKFTALQELRVSPRIDNFYLIDALEVSDMLSVVSMNEHNELKNPLLTKMSEYNQQYKQNLKPANLQMWSRIAFSVVGMRAVTKKQTDEKDIPEAKLAGNSFDQLFRMYAFPLLGHKLMRTGFDGIKYEIKSLIPDEFRSEIKMEVKVAANKRYIECTVTSLAVKAVLQKVLGHDFIRDTEKEHVFVIQKPKQLWAVICLTRDKYTRDIRAELEMQLKTRVQATLSSIPVKNLYLTRFNCFKPHIPAKLSDIVTFEKVVNVHIKNESEQLKRNLPTFTAKEIHDACQHYDAHKGYSSIITPVYINELKKIASKHVFRDAKNDTPDTEIIIALSRCLLVDSDVKAKMDTVNASVKNPDFEIKKIYLKLAPLAMILQAIKSASQEKAVFLLLASLLLKEEGIIRIYKNIPEVQVFSDCLSAIVKLKDMNPIKLNLIATCALANIHNAALFNCILNINKKNMLSSGMVMMIFDRVLKSSVDSLVGKRLSDDLARILMQLNSGKLMTIAELEESIAYGSSATSNSVPDKMAKPK